jgi:hypothetical protein
MIFALPAAALLAGCGPPAATVSGVVTVGGVPAKDGMVMFYPVGGGPTPYGAVGPDGRFTLAAGTDPKLAPGEYKVTVVVHGDAPPWVDKSNAPPGRPRVTAGKYADPATTPLTRTVKPGANEFALDVEPGDRR